MNDRPLLITNNPACSQALGQDFECIFDQGWSYGDVLTAVRDKIHEGYTLLTHPLAGSMKPNQTPYRSILLTKKPLDKGEKFDSKAMIERASEAFEKFQRQRTTPDWNPRIQRDFQTIDLSMMQGAASRIHRTW